MKIGTTRPSLIVPEKRLDANFFLSAGIRARLRLELARKSGLELEPLGGKDAIAKCWRPQRFKRVYAVQGEESVPYLRPYDVFNYLPVAADWLSKTKNKKLTSYFLNTNMILQTCSGRNLGPATVVDSYISKFVTGDDIIRIEIEDETTRYFVLSFLMSPIGQELLRRDKTGSVIDHISPDNLNEQLIPRFEDAQERLIADKMKEAVTAREEARETIQKTFDSFEQLLPTLDRKTPLKQGATVKATNLKGRLDVAPHDTFLDQIRSRLRKMGGRELESYATVLKPAGRYTTRYVEKEYGIPILSGSQVLQVTPIKLHYMPLETLHDADRYRLSAKSIVIQADGRAEESLGFPAVVTTDRDGWLASGHVGRIVPKEGTDSGWLYLAIRSRYVQTQLKALACGSVVDALYEADIGKVILPPSLSDSKEVNHAWGLFATAQEAETEALTTFDNTLNSFAGDVTPSQ